MSKKKDCIGKVLSQREGLIGNDILNMVGFIPVNSEDQLYNGSHFITLDTEAAPENDQGYMSSVAWSPMLKSYIGLGFLKDGQNRLGEIIEAKNYIRNTHIKVKVVSPHFFDPKGERLRA